MEDIKDPVLMRKTLLTRLVNVLLLFLLHSYSEDNCCLSDWKHLYCRLDLLREIVLHKSFLLELVVQLSGHNLSQRHWLLIIPLLRYLETCFFIIICIQCCLVFCIHRSVVLLSILLIISSFLVVYYLGLSFVYVLSRWLLGLALIYNIKHGSLSDCDSSNVTGQHD